jgi:hypothetical protein
MDNIEEIKKKALLFVYYCGKLTEGGFIEGGYKVTPTGFDIAMDLIEEGLKIDREFAVKCCVEMNMDPNIAKLVIEMQRIGLPAMIEISKSLLDENFQEPD